jgi:phosphoglycolate phosphatase-like HAD superfamily hydrolase
MNFINTIVEFEGPVVNVQPRYWAAHCEAIKAVGFQGPPESEFWRLVRTGAPDGQLIRFGKDRHVQEYARIRDERTDASDLMKLDELQPVASENLRLLKKLGACHLVTLSRNRDGINATLDRLDVWMHFDQKRALPEDQDRRVTAMREIVGGQRCTLAVVGSVPMAYIANEAGCKVVGIKGGTAFPKRLRQVGVDVFYSDLEELTEAITTRDPDLQRIGLF